MASTAGQIVVLRTFASEVEAEIARAVLEAHDIPALVLHNDAGGMYPSLTFVHGVRLMVRREDARVARMLLDTPVDVPESADDEA
ncbi:MAG TPA: DUF2007 domain-containing protein [Gemmatimonadaceae bacterium]